MKTEVLSVMLCGAMVLFAPWQLNVLFYVWLVAAVLRTHFKIKKAEEAAIAKTSADRDLNVAELNSYRAAHHKAAHEASRNAQQHDKQTQHQQDDKQTQHQQDKYMQHEQHQQDKRTQHQQHQQDKQMQHQQDKKYKLDRLAQKKSADQVTADREFVSKNKCCMLFK